MIVSSRRARKSGDVIAGPGIELEIRNTAGRLIDRIVQPLYVIREATLEEWIADSVGDCGPLPRDFVPDPGLHYYEVSSD